MPRLLAARRHQADALLVDGLLERGARERFVGPTVAQINRDSQLPSQEHSLESWRAYNYPHVTTVYWSLYRSARYASPPLARRRPWQWYLRRAHATALAVWRWGGDPWTKKQGNGVGTAQWGLMVGSVFELVLSDLRREGWAEEAASLQEATEKRMAVWLSMPFPYGSTHSPGLDGGQHRAGSIHGRTCE